MSRNSLGLPGRQTKTRVASLYDIVLFFNHFSLSVTMMSIFSSWSCLTETYLGRVTLVSVNSYKKMIKVKSIRRKNG